MQSEKEIARQALVRNILYILSLLSSHLKLYPQGNEVVRVTLSRLMLQLEKYFVAGEDLDLVVARHGFIWHDQFIDRASFQLQALANTLFMHGVAAIKLRCSVSEFEVMTFLRLVGRKPADSWDEGGIGAALEMRQMENLEVFELSENDFTLRDEAAQAASSAGDADQSDLWDRFALGVFQRQHEINSVVLPPGLGPAELAAETSAFLDAAGSAAQQRFMGEVSNFLVSLQHENIRAYRVKGLEKLTSYIKHLSPHLQRLFLKNIFNYNLNADFAEEFFADLSDDLIMAALESAARGESYIPPVILDLLGKLARNRELLPDVIPLADGGPGGELEAKARELFRSDEIEKYVPEQYRNALQQILRSNAIDAGDGEALSYLKISLQEEKIEEHTGQIIVHILSHEADECHLSGIFSHLEKIVTADVDAGNYPAILNICALCGEQGPAVSESLQQILRTDVFVARLLDGVSRYGKEKYDALGKLITAIGPACVDPLLERLAEEKSRSIRSFYIQALKGLGPSVAESAVARLGDPRWYYLRNLLALLREVGTPAQAGAVRPLFRHPHPKVRSEATKVGLCFRDVQAQRLLLEQLEAKDVTTVAAAVAMARFSREPRIIAGLAALLEKDVLFDYRLEVKRGVVAALLEIDQRQALPVLQRFVKSYNLLHPLHHAQLCREISEILTGLGPHHDLAGDGGRLRGVAGVPRGREGES